MMSKIIVIIGPTACGKTKTSIELAKKLNAEIINADAVQVYKDVNIGTFLYDTNKRFAILIAVVTVIIFPL